MQKVITPNKIEFKTRKRKHIFEGTLCRPIYFDNKILSLQKFCIFLCLRLHEHANWHNRSIYLSRGKTGQQSDTSSAQDLWLHIKTKTFGSCEDMTSRSNNGGKSCNAKLIISEKCFGERMWMAMFDSMQNKNRNPVYTYTLSSLLLGLLTRTWFSGSMLPQVDYCYARRNVTSRNTVMTEDFKYKHHGGATIPSIRVFKRYVRDLVWNRFYQYVILKQQRMKKWK